MSILELFCDVDDFCQWLSRWEDAKLFDDRGLPTPGNQKTRLFISPKMS